MLGSKTSRFSEELIPVLVPYFCRQEDIKLLLVVSAAETEKYEQNNRNAGQVSSTHAFEEV